MIMLIQATMLSTSYLNRGDVESSICKKKKKMQKMCWKWDGENGGHLILQLNKPFKYEVSKLH